MPVDYNQLAETYDLTRTANIAVLNRFAEEVTLDGATVLDFGCGTGNFAHALCRLTIANVYGVEPSDGMRAKAIAKGIDARAGDHARIPFDANTFDFIYMTDVIHHVPDLPALFTELLRVLKPGGRVGILTESHAQLASRFWVTYFPTTVAVERGRYPDIPDILCAAEAAGLATHKVVSTDQESRFTIAEDFVRLVEDKGYSVFRLIGEVDYQAGLAALRADFAARTPITATHGETLVWLRKAGEAITYGHTLTAAQFNDLRVSVGWRPIEARLAQSGLDHTSFLIVAREGDVPVGMARAITDFGYQVLITDVVVRPTHQGRGIGSEMMRRVMAWIEESSAPGQGKMINLMAAHGREGFYRTFGFAARPDDAHGPGMTQWIERI